MDFCRNISVSGGLPANYQPEQQLLSPSCSKLGSLDDLFSGHSMEEGDVNMEWLSIFVEDCLSSSGNCLPPTPLMPSNPQSTTSAAAGTTNTAANPNVKKSHLENSLSIHKFVVPGKARSKRKRSPNNKTLFQGTTPLCWSQQYPTTSDPPLLHQAHWLADSELILPKKSTSPNSTKSKDELILPMKGTSPNSSRSRSRDEVLLPKKGTSPNSSRSREEVLLPMKSTSPNSSRSREFSTDNEQEVNKDEGSPGQVGQHGQGRRCTHCLSQKTPQWRAGPQGPKTLCNACGVRYKSGRLLPEYRPAKSPTFLSYKHSNSHKKVLEMRMSLLSSSPNSSSS